MKQTVQENQNAAQMHVGDGILFVASRGVPHNLAFETPFLYRLPAPSVECFVDTIFDPVLSFRVCEPFFYYCRHTRCTVVASCLTL